MTGSSRLTVAGLLSGVVRSRTCHCSPCRCRSGASVAPERVALLMIGNIIAAIVIGIIAGYLGRALLLGPDPLGFVAR